MVPKKDNVISGCISRDISARMMEVTVLLNSTLVTLYVEPCLGFMAEEGWGIWEATDPCLGPCLEIECR